MDKNISVQILTLPVSNCAFYGGLKSIYVVAFVSKELQETPKSNSF